MKSPYTLTVTPTHVQFSGSLDITRDAVGLKNARQALNAFKPLGSSTPTTLAKTIAPFSDEALSLEDLSLESAEDKVSIYGTANFPREDPLPAARWAVLYLAIASTVRTLEQELLANTLPQQLKNKTPTVGGNPFA
jgi:hypothetical protein